MINPSLLRKNDFCMLNNERDRALQIRFAFFIHPVCFSIDQESRLAQDFTTSLEIFHFLAGF